MTFNSEKFCRILTEKQLNIEEVSKKQMLALIAYQDIKEEYINLILKILVNLRKG